MRTKIILEVHGHKQPVFCLNKIYCSFEDELGIKLGSLISLNKILKLSNQFIHVRTKNTPKNFSTGKSEYYIIVKSKDEDEDEDTEDEMMGLKRFYLFRKEKGSKYSDEKITPINKLQYEDFNH